jgi:hypothetical protein
MATKYYVNKNEQPDTKDHEVHTETCHKLPSVDNRTYLGSFESCSDAVKEAKKHYKQSNGCIHCSKACHTG